MHLGQNCSAEIHAFCRNPVAAMMDAPRSGLPDDVLLVEDDAIIAMDFEDTILRFGVRTVRTAGNVARALQLIEQRPPDFALLDISLMREKSFAVAERLEALGIPFVFISGYGAEAGLPAALRQKPRLPKPCTDDALETALRSAARGVVK